MHIRGAAFAATLSIAFLADGAQAQDWKEYDYPDAGFAAQFPAPPTVSEIQYRAGEQSDGKADGEGRRADVHGSSRRSTLSPTPRFPQVRARVGRLNLSLPIGTAPGR